METKKGKPNRDKELDERSDLFSSVLRSSIFDTKNYYYYFTELSKEHYSK